MSAIRTDSLAELSFWKKTWVMFATGVQPMGTLNSVHVEANDTFSNGQVNPVPDAIGIRFPPPTVESAQKVRVPPERRSTPNGWKKMGPVNAPSTASIDSDTAAGR